MVGEESEGEGDDEEEEEGGAAIVEMEEERELSEELPPEVDESEFDWSVFFLHA